MILVESMICLFSNMGNDLFFSAKSKKEEISNSKTRFLEKKSRKCDASRKYDLLCSQIWAMICS